MSAGEKSRVVVGLMSGTSLDGITAAVARFTPENGLHRCDLLAHLTRPFQPAQRDRLAKAMTTGSPAEYCRLNVDVAHWLADAAVAVIAEAGVARSDIAAVASHGQTIWHEPGHSTWQVGEAAVIAERTGVGVVANFRARDVAAGGQGAPLVPIADAMLWGSTSSWRALQNIGGMANVTIVPPNGDLRSVRAFDTGPGVAVIDAVTRMLRPTMAYDVDGKLAAAGTPNEAVIAQLLAASYFAAEPPKSTGRESFGDDYARALISECRRANPQASDEDCIATATALTARSIADAYTRFVPEPVSEVLISGGGARNPALVAMLARALGTIAVRSFDEIYFDGDAKEAVAFAFLGYLHVTGKTGNVPGATGAHGARLLGSWTPA